ncbi:MAG: chemotaxis protein CheW [Clostridia bacterium]|nr:chemotaxis protein CheW [Clostridia bacterium]
MDGMVKNEARQFVVFKIGKEEYGVDIKKITTIERMMQIARVPKTPEYIKGVINLRGEIIPIMDMRLRFNLPQFEETEDTRIIIIKIEDMSVGIIVDAVAEVLELTDDAIENIANFSIDMSADYILGVGKVNGRIITLLSIEKMIEIAGNE